MNDNNERNSGRHACGTEGIVLSLPLTPSHSLSLRRINIKPMKLYTDNVVKTYGKRTVVKGASVEVRQGEI